MRLHVRLHTGVRAKTMENQSGNADESRGAEKLRRDWRRDWRRNLVALRQLVASLSRCLSRRLAENVIRNMVAGEIPAYRAPLCAGSIRLRWSSVRSAFTRSEIFLGGTVFSR